MSVNPNARIDWAGGKYTPRQIREMLDGLTGENDLLRKSAVCSRCGRFLPEKKFYKDNSPSVKAGKILVCKDCVKKVFYRVGEDGVEHESTKESLIEGLKLMNKPFKQPVYDRAVRLAGSSKQYKDIAGNYMRYMLMDDNFHDQTFGDSDFFLGKIKPIDEAEALKSDDQEIIDTQKQLETDRDDVIRIIGYDPFLQEDYSDQPFLYSQLLGILDSSEDSSDDQVKIQSAVSIVRSFLQIAKIDDSLTNLMRDPKLIKQYSSEINKMQDTKVKIQSGITKLAAESCISLKNAKGNSKGDNTWTGKIKKCKDLSLRAAENNGYDLKTCRGMMQCAEISSNAIIKALKLDESDYSDMLAEQREMLTSLNYKYMKAEEAMRILLRENLDLKDLIEVNGIELIDHLVDLDELLDSVDDPAPEEGGNEREEDSL